MQSKISRIRLSNALSDALIDLKVALLEIEGVETQYKLKPRVLTTDAEGEGGGEGRWVTMNGTSVFHDGEGNVEKELNSLRGAPLPEEGNIPKLAKSATSSYSSTKRTKNPKSIRLPKAEYAMVVSELNTNLTKDELAQDFRYPTHPQSCLHN